MDHPGQWMRRRDAGQHFGKPVGIRRVTGDDIDVRTQRSQLVHEGTARPAAACQEQVAHAVLGHQVTGDQGAERAGTAGDQHRSFGIQPSRHGEYHLAHVPGLTEEPDRLRCPAYVPCRHRQRLQHAVIAQVPERDQHLLDAVRAGVQQVVRLVIHPGMGGCDGLRVAYVGLAQLQETATARQQSQ